MMFGSMLLNATSCGGFVVHRTKNGKTTTVTATTGGVKHLGMVETNDPSGKRSRETITVRWSRPLYGVSEQDNAPEDIIEWNGTSWRVIGVKILASTYKATAVRMSTDRNDCNEAKCADGDNSLQFIRPVG